MNEIDGEFKGTTTADCLDGSDTLFHESRGVFAEDELLRRSVVRGYSVNR